MQKEDSFLPDLLCLKLKEKLHIRKEEGNYRQIQLQKTSKIDFFTNDYLGVSKNDLIKLPKKSNFKGSTGSRLLSGNSKEALSCEKKVAQFFLAESSLIFNSGYDANIGLISTIIGREDIIIYDEKIHASLRDGIVLSRGKSYSFSHNDLMDLQKKLDKFSTIKNVYVIIESLYSMDGERAPLKDISNLCEKFRTKLIVDEAHSVGIFGENGKGLCVENNIHKKVFARIITFSKAYGFIGAAVLAKEEVIQFLINFCRSFIYTTALPPLAYYKIEKILKKDLSRERNALIKNIQYYTDCVNSAQIGPIQFIKCSEFMHFEEIVRKLKKVKIFQKIIKYPTVPKSEEGIRLTFHSFNTKKEIEILLSILNPVK
ncbi:MAG: pyridoxal phosphate-dependent aminotransferase family protein [Flavobacteriia bacterium]|nr:pyridoxal phosphate-dependent aminotransferase family protein [Flavobacteriia bacterium]